MLAKFRPQRVLLALVSISVVAVMDQASAITAEVAKACRALTAKEFPPREIGNPAAGSAKGTGRVQQAYFDKCVANGGKVDSGAVK